MNRPRDCPLLVEPPAPLVTGTVEEDDRPISGFNEVVPIVEELVAEPPLNPPFVGPDVVDDPELDDD